MCPILWSQIQQIQNTVYCHLQRDRKLWYNHILLTYTHIHRRQCPYFHCVTDRIQSIGFVRYAQVPNSTCNVWIHVSLSKSHTLIVMSCDAEYSLLFCSSIARSATMLVCPSNVWRHCHVSVSHTLIVLSSDPENSLCFSVEKDKHTIVALWRSRAAICVLEMVSHTSTILF
jgi:hypothetical protein